MPPDSPVLGPKRICKREREIRSVEDAPHYPAVGLGEHSEAAPTPGVRH